MWRVRCASSDGQFYAVHGRWFSSTRCPYAGLLDMPNARRFLWRRLNRYLSAQFRNRWLFTDARRLMLGKIFRKVNFRFLCMKIIPRRRFFCAGFLCLPHIRASPLFLHCWRGDALRLLRVRSCAHILCAQARQFLGWRFFRCNRLLRKCLLDRWLCSSFCRFLSESTPSKLLWCWGWRMLRRFWLRA